MFRQTRRPFSRDSLRVICPPGDKSFGREKYITLFLASHCACIPLVLRRNTVPAAVRFFWTITLKGGVLSRGAANMAKARQAEVNATAAFMQRWGETDPEAAMNALQGIINPGPYFWWNAPSIGLADAAVDAAFSLLESCCLPSTYRVELLQATAMFFADARTEFATAAKLLEKALALVKTIPAKDYEDTAKREHAVAVADIERDLNLVREVLATATALVNGEELSARRKPGRWWREPIEMAKSLEANQIRAIEGEGIYTKHARTSRA
jgi:hypothetical protein